MSDAITEAITSAATDAGLIETGSNGELTETVDSSTTEVPATEVADEGTEAAGADGDESVTPEATVETQEEKTAREAEEAELTVRPGENAIPHPRVKKMVAKAEEKGRAASAKIVAERDTEITRLKPYEAEYRRLNQLADTDPERFIEAMAVANPAKWKPMQARLAGAPQATVKETEAAGAAFTKPRPKPNAKNPDGSMSYDEAGLDELLAWTAEKAVHQANAQFEARMSPIEKERKDAEAAARFNREQQPRIKAQVQKARETWGDLFEADYAAAEAGKPSEIITYMNTHRVPFEAACTAVLLPKERARLKADKIAMRKSLAAEINERPAAASSGPRSAVKAPAGARTMEQIILESSRAAGLDV